MGTLKFFLLAILIGTAMNAEAISSWGMVTGSSGFQGDFFAGGYYRFNPRHTLAISIGSYTLDFVRAQLNVGYVYTPFEFTGGSENISWSVIDGGVSLSFALDHDYYFLKDPVQYPQENYYDQTRDRGALQLGTSLSFYGGEITVRYFVSLLTIGAVAYFNNREGYRQFLSSGISVKIPF